MQIIASFFLKLRKKNENRIMASLLAKGDVDVNAPRPGGRATTSYA